MIASRGQTRQPQPARIDWSNPLTRGLTHCYNSRNPTTNLASMTLMESITGTPGNIVPFKDGVALALDGSSGFSTVKNVPAALPVTFGVYAGTTQANAEGPILAINLGGSPSYSIGTGSTFAGREFPRYFITYSGAELSITDPITNLRNTNAAWVCRSRTTTDHALIVGNNIYTSTTATGAIAAGSNVSLGRQVAFNFTITAMLNARPYLACLWNRALSNAEAFAFNRNPWQIFLNRPSRRYFASPVVGAPVTLRANPVKGGGAAANPIWGYVA